MHFDRKGIVNSPFGTTVKMATVILCGELLIMLLTESIFKPLFEAQPFLWEFLNLVCLAIIVAPALQILVLNPMKRQQIKLEQQNDDLTITSATFEAMKGVVVTDINHNILKINHAFTTVTGYTSEEVIGKTPAILHSGRHDAEFYRSMLGTLERNRCWQGEIWNRRKNGEIYPEWLTITTVTSEKGHIYHVGIFSDISQRKALEEKVHFLAYHDRLTRLPSRELFYDRLSQAISQARRKHEYLALLFLDLDGFKAINDSYGHEAGDEVLKVTAKHLLSCVRDIDTVSRLGGDEFAIVLGGIDLPSDVTLIADKIIQSVNKPIMLQNRRKCSVGVSIGIAIYPDNAAEIDRLMNTADKAMYESKACGKNIYTFAKKQTQTNTLPWVTLNTSLLLNVPEMDRQHQALACTLNTLNFSVINNESTESIAQQLDDFVLQIRTHFTDEENLMDGYIDRNVHKQEHERLLRELDYLKNKFNSGGELLVLQSLKEWLFSHILGLDRQLADFLLQKKTGRTSIDSDATMPQHTDVDTAKI